MEKYDRKDFFPIIDISLTHQNPPEQMGTKEKFWYDEEKYMFKKSTPDTGEHWAEKIASELAVLIGMPSAEYDLAKYKNDYGVRTKNITLDEKTRGNLVHGNEIMSVVYPEYDKKEYKQRKYTIKNVFNAIEMMNHYSFYSLLENNFSASNIFVGYLLFDAWIANQDRHHENWAFLLTKDNNMRKWTLCPSFDHASSLGRNDNDKVKKDKLIAKNSRGGMLEYTARAKTPFFEGGKQIKTFEAFQIAATMHQNAASYWKQQLADVDFKKVENIFCRFKRDILSDISIDFALEILKINKKRLLGE